MSTWRLCWYWIGRDSGWRCGLSNHSSESAADARGRQAVRDGASHYEVFPRSGRQEMP